MKKVLWLIVCLMTMVLSVNAQDDMYLVQQSKNTNNEVNETFAKNNGWVSLTHEADELIGNEKYTSLVFSNDCGSVVTWNNEQKKFRIICNDNMFDSEVTKAGWDLSYRNLFIAIVGLYDANDKLLKKKKVYFEIGASHYQGISTHGSTGKNEGKEILKYIRNNKGYVRIVAPLSGTNAKFDIKVPCMNN